MKFGEGLPSRNSSFVRRRGAILCVGSPADASAAGKDTFFALVHAGVLRAFLHDIAWPTARLRRPSRRVAPFEFGEDPVLTAGDEPSHDFAVDFAQRLQPPRDYLRHEEHRPSVIEAHRLADDAERRAEDRVGDAFYVGRARFANVALQR